MESILARALEYTLKYWLKSFSRDQFKLQGRTVQLSNLGTCPFGLVIVGFSYSLLNLETSFGELNVFFFFSFFWGNLGRY